MRNVVLIGDVEALAPYAEALERDGFFPKVRAVGDEEAVGEGFDVAVVDLPSIGEDAEAKALLDGASASDGLPVVVLADGEQIDAFEPVRDVRRLLCGGGRRRRTW